MAVMESTSNLRSKYIILYANSSSIWNNAAFYTTDGMRYELRKGGAQSNLYLHENKNIKVCTQGMSGDLNEYEDGSGYTCGGCGSYGLNNNSDNTTKPPCLVTVDVNGDKKPNPDNVNCKNVNCAKNFKYSDTLGLRLTDVFSIMITDKQAIPYGVAAQRAMYQARK